jgi:hypothetical protein
MDTANITNLRVITFHTTDLALIWLGSFCATIAHFFKHFSCSFTTSITIKQLLLFLLFLFLIDPLPILSTKITESILIGNLTITKAKTAKLFILLLMNDLFNICIWQYFIIKFLTIVTNTLVYFNEL